MISSGFGQPPLGSTDSLEFFVATVAGNLFVEDQHVSRVVTVESDVEYDYRVVPVSISYVVCNAKIDNQNRKRSLRNSCNVYTGFFCIPLSVLSLDLKILILSKH